MATANQFDASRFYISKIEDYGLLPNNASYDPLPSAPWGRNWPQHVHGKGFVLVEDHRARPAEQFGEDLAQEATAWWLPEDTYGTPAREMKTAGPLPAGALLKAPQQPLAEAQATKRASINAGFDAAMTASLTMPSSSTPALAFEVAYAIYDWRTEDPDGYAALLAIHTARRDALLSAVAAATSVEAVQAITVSYAV